MRRQFHTKIIQAATIVMACFSFSCEKIEQEPVGMPVSFMSSKLYITKASPTVIGDDFGVWGNVDGDMFMRNARYSASGDATDGMLYYWPDTEDSVHFIAYYPYDNTSTETQAGVARITVTGNRDMLYGRAASLPTRERVPLSFNHIMGVAEFWGKTDTSTVDWASISGAGFSGTIYNTAYLDIPISGPASLIYPVSKDTVLYTGSGIDLPCDSFQLAASGYVIPQRLSASTTLALNAGLKGTGDSVVYYGRKTTSPGDSMTIAENGVYQFKYLISSDRSMLGGNDNWTNGTGWESWDYTDDAYVEHYYYMGFAGDGTKFSNQVAGLDFANGDYLEARMDLRRMVRAKQNVVSFGEDIANWSPSGSVEKFNLHIYFPNDVNDKRVRFSAVSNNKVNNNARRTMGIIKTSVFNYDPDNNYILTVRFDKYGFYINGQLITRNEFDPVEASKTPELPNNPSGVYPDVYTYPYYFMPHFQGVLNLQFGSMEGNTRSYADYIYVMYHHKIR